MMREKSLSVNEEFGNYLRGNFIHIEEDMFYILSYERNMNRFLIVGAGSVCGLHRYLYMYELVTVIKQNGCELYDNFTNEFPEYFI